MCRHIFFLAAAWLRMVWHHKFLYHWIAHLLRNIVVIFFSKQGKYLPTYRKLYGKRLKNDINCCPAAGLCMQLFHFHGGQRNTQFVSVSWKFEVCSLITFYASHKRSFSLYNLYEFWPFRDVEITRVHKITLYALSVVVTVQNQSEVGLLLYYASWSC